MKCVIVFLYLLTDGLELRKISPTSFTDLNITRYRRYADDNDVSCILPPQPANGRWIVVNGEGREGETIGVNTLLKFHCKKGYKVSGRSSYRVCDKNWNTKRFPECRKLCPPIYSTPTVIVKCTNRKGREIGCHEATDESYLTYTCASFYEAPFGYKTTLFCSDGDWNAASPICQPICGKKVSDDTTPLIYGGKVEEVIEYPWITALFRKDGDLYTNICGGSLISQKLVLTAAHCVTNEYGDASPEENFLIAGGKLHNKYHDTRDPNAQYLNIFRIIVHPSYKGDSRRYLGDIAVLVTKEPFVLNKFIQPVCFSDVKNIHLQTGKIGVVAGFGIKEGGEASEELRTLEIPYKSQATCARELPGDWGDRYNVIDKLCAGHYNKSMSICPGDSGNGLFFKNSENNRYYVHGVVSLGHSKKGQCNVQENSLYTKVAFHYDFIDREVTKYYLKDCSLPPYPENGKWVAENPDKNPGDIVPSSTLLEISCNEGYKLSSDKSHIKCESSFIMPTCQKLCAEINLPSAIDYNCTSKEGEAVHCNEATDDATLTFTCPKNYRPPDGTKNTRRCLKGAWESPTPSCEQINASTESPVEEDEPYARVICMYEGEQYENGVRPEDLNASLCTHVIYDSVGLSHDGNLKVKRESESNRYRSVVDMKKRNGKLKVLLSVYGPGKKTTDAYPVVAADPVKRTTFVSSVTNFLQTYGYDGVNIYWDAVVIEDKENYVTLLKEIKEAFEKRRWLLSATVYYAPHYLGYNPSAIYEVVDWANIGNYDFYDEWSEYTGQNSALHASSLEGDYASSNFNFDAIIGNWGTYGLKKDKISPTISFFGRYFTLKDTKKHGVHAPVISGTSSDLAGRINYSEICEKYANWTTVWDDEQKNPYKYNRNKWVGYDNKESVKLKAQFSAIKGFFGVTVYPVNGDDVHGKCGPKQILLKHVHAGLGDISIDLEN